MARSAAAMTVVMSEAVLLPVLGSGSVAVTVAESVIVPTALGTKLIVSVAEAPFASDPRIAVTTPLACEAVPWLGFAETNVVVPGRLSVSTTLVAGLGPLLVTV